jgi:hypothetical protein
MLQHRRFDDDDGISNKTKNSANNKISLHNSVNKYKIRNYYSKMKETNSKKKKIGRADWTLEKFPQISFSFYTTSVRQNPFGESKKLFINYVIF